MVLTLIIRVKTKFSGPDVFQVWYLCLKNSGKESEALYGPCMPCNNEQDWLQRLIPCDMCPSSRAVVRGSGKLYGQPQIL